MIQTRFMICCVMITILPKITICAQNRDQTKEKTSQETQIVLKQVNTNIDTQLELMNTEIKKMNNRIDLELSKLETEIQKTNVIIQSCCQDRYEPNDISIEIQKQYDIYIRPILMRIEFIEKELKHLKQISDISKPDSISDYLGLLSLITTIVVSLAGFVIVMGGISIYRSWVDSKRMLKEELETKFNPWLEEREKECATQIKDMLDKHEGKMIQYSPFIKLKQLITLPSKPTEEEIYPLLTSLTSQPRFGYRSLFNRIKDMNISQAVNDRIDEGLQKLSEIETTEQGYQH